jgi:hypothetical protein
LSLLIKYHILGSVAVPSQQQQPPSEEDVALLRQVLANFTEGLGFGLSDKLLTQTIDRWELTKQPADELAGLYRVRATVACCRRADGCRL